MTSRRQLLGLFPGLALPIAFPALAQRRDRPTRIAVLGEGIDPRIRASAFWAQFHKRMGELGHVEGKTYVMEWRWDNAEPGRLPALAAELVALKPDIILGSTTTTALALKKATASVPVVIAGAPDPVKLGIVASLAKPGGNITGISVRTSEFSGKLVQLLREVVPKAQSLSYLTETASQASILTFRELQENARTLGLSVTLLDGRNPANVEAAFGTMARERADGLIVGINVLVFQQRQQIVEAAARQRIPAIYARREYVDAGGLMSYGPDLDALYPRLAELVHRILQGGKPADIPYEQLSTFRMVINLKTAKMLGIRMPQSVLAHADEVIR